MRNTVKYFIDLQELRVELQPGADEQQQAGQHQQLALHAQFSQVNISSVMRIRIRMFLGLPDPHPDRLVTSTDSAPDPACL